VESQRHIGTLELPGGRRTGKGGSHEGERKIIRRTKEKKGGDRNGCQFGGRKSLATRKKGGNLQRGSPSRVARKR